MLSMDPQCTRILFSVPKNGYQRDLFTMFFCSSLSRVDVKNTMVRRIPQTRPKPTDVTTNFQPVCSYRVLALTVYSLWHAGLTLTFSEVECKDAGTRAGDGDGTRAFSSSPTSSFLSLLLLLSRYSQGSVSFRPPVTRRQSQAFSLLNLLAVSPALAPSGGSSSPELLQSPTSSLSHNYSPFHHMSSFPNLSRFL